MVQTSTSPSPIRFDIQQELPSLYNATVTIPADFVQRVYKEAARSQQKSVSAPGFPRGHAPIEYIEQNFKSILVEHTAEFLYKYCVLSHLYQSIRDQKLLVAGDPRLERMHVQPNSDAHFVFSLTVFPTIVLQEWKYFIFKAAKRKNYKDLDKQVELFISEEEQKERVANSTTIHLNDWVYFTITLADENNNPLLGDHVESLWCKIGAEEVDTPLQELFLGKKAGDIFCSRNEGLQEYFSDQLDTDYNFLVSICDVLSDTFFCLDQFKRHFKIKTNKEMYQKLVEVFSYRNDLSQRRTMVEDSLKLLLAKHKFEVPNHLTIRQQKVVLEAVQNNPDYHVYRVQKDFKERVKQLAEKQAKEALIIDQLAFDESITITPQDIKSYLNLTKRARMKEFIFFDPPTTKIRGQELPISAEELKRVCAREKTLNHLIYHLTKK